MALGSTLILPPQSTTISVEVIPAYLALTSIISMINIESNPGLGEWVSRTYMQLNTEERNFCEAMVFGFGPEGLYNLVPPGPQTDTFPAFLDALSEIDPHQIQQSALSAWEHSAHLRIFVDAPEIRPINRDRMLRDYGYYEASIMSLLKKDLNQPSLLPEIHRLLNHPQEFKERTVEFLGYIWNSYLKTDWERIEPELFDVADAFSHVPLSGHTPLEAARIITGRDLSGFLDGEALKDFERIRFLPSLHNGPYISWFGNETDLYLVYGARMPDLATLHQSSVRHSRTAAVDHSTLLHRLTSLADQTRFDILLALHKNGPMGTQEIMDAFDLNKSAASRHLRNLNASGLIEERRESDNRTKFYILDQKSIRQLTDTLIHLLG